METQLLTNETKTGEISLDNAVLTLTNRRLIFTNTSTSKDVFMGLNEIKSISVNTVDVTYTGSKIRLGNWFFIIAICIDIALGVYQSNSIHQYGSDAFLGITFAMLLWSPVAAIISGVIIGIMNAYINSTKTTAKRSQIIITKTDNSYFLNRDYDIEKLNKLKTFELEINNLIYK